ncbi:MAG: serine protease [Bacteroidetes bacterium]|nr:serine protease [Bacteroidota bacterium]
MTCRHVVDVAYDSEKQSIALFDNELERFTPVHQIIYPDNEHLDLAYLPNGLSRQKEHFFPILTPEELMIGEDVYSFGHYSAEESSEKMTFGYFKGHIVAFFKNPLKGFSPTITLSYPVIEGLSGSPVLTYHNGPKLVGVCYGSQAQRIMASEIIEYKDTQKEYKETINRIVEFGLAHHPSVIIDFLTSKGITGFVVSTDTIKMNGF